MTTSATPTSTAAAPAIVGTPAPELSLPSTSGETVSLASFRGRQPVLVAFFPLAFTSTCTAEVCDFSGDYDAFAASGAAVLPVSVDSVPTLREFKAKYELRTDLLSDFKRVASRAWGVLDEERFFSRRSYFLVDRDGIVRWAYVESQSGQRRSNAELLAEIARL